MEENENGNLTETPVMNAQRKLRKIKRVRIQNPEQESSFGVPEKVSLPQVTNEEYDNPDIYYSNNGDAENIRFISEEDFPQEAEASLADYFKDKTVLLLMCLALVFGALVGNLFFSSKEIAKSGLEGVVVNPDVPQGRSRCGLVEPHQGCVLYIMNPKNQDITGKEFFATAAQWTKRERYIIETGNMHYSSKRIRPGYIAQINIPPYTN